MKTPLFLLLLFSALSAGAQNEAAIRKEFERFNINGDEWLDGIEVTNCNCKHLDKNGNGEVSYAEFKAGKGGKTITTTTTHKAPVTTPAVPANKAANTSVGKRVEVGINGHWYKATVLQVKGDSYFVHYDGYPASDDVWILRSYTRDLDEAEQPVSVTCSFAEPAGVFTNNSPPSEALFKKEIYDWYKRAVTGGVTSPLEIGVVFTSFVSSPPYKNTVTNVPGQGATRRHEGAPANTTIYTAKTTFFVCERYNSGVTQKQVNSTFSFFKNSSGEWTCSKDN